MRCPRCELVSRTREPRAPCRSHAAGLAVEPAAEDVAGHRRDEHHHQCIRGRLAVGEVGLVRPELRGQRLDVGRVEDERGGQLGRRLEEHERERRAEAGRDQGQGDAPQDRPAPDAERAPHLLESDRRAGHRGAHRHDRQREEHDGVRHHQQRAGLVEAALQEVLGHVGEAQGDDETRHGQNDEVRPLEAEHRRRGKAHREQSNGHGGERRHHAGGRRVAEGVQRGLGQGRRRGQRAGPAADDQVDDGTDRDAQRQHDEEHGRRPARQTARADANANGRSCRAAPAPTRDVRPWPRTASSLARRRRRAARGSARGHRPRVR